MAQGQLEVSGDQVIDNVFDVYDTGGLGDCLFYSLGFALNNNTAVDADTALVIRREICDRHDIMINGINAELNANDDQINPASSDGRMCNQGEWGEDVEIAKAARIYDIPIIVYMKDHTTGMYDGVVREYNRFNEIQAGTFCPQMQKYFVNGPFLDVSSRLISYYLPANSNGKEPILILNKGQAHYQILLPKGSYAGVQSHGASLSNLASLSQVAKPYPTQEQIIELLTRLANNMENKKGVSKILEEAGTIMLLTEEMIEGLVETSLSLPQVAQPVSQHTTSIILNKPYPTEEQIIELLTSLAKFKGNVIEVNRILEKAGSKMQLTDEMITGLIDASEKL